MQVSFSNGAVKEVPVHTNTNHLLLCFGHTTFHLSMKHETEITILGMHARHMTCTSFLSFFRCVDNMP